MASSMGARSKVVFFAGALALAITGCGDAFTATGAGGGTAGSTSTGGGGTAGTAGSTAGGTGGTGGTTAPECSAGETRPCHTVDDAKQNKGICKDGKNKCVDGAWGTDCVNEVLPEPEMCGDTVDSDCDGSIDNGCPCTGDATQPCYTGPDNTENVGICKSGLQTCHDGTWGTCDGSVTPGTESCTNAGADDDCNGTKDDVPGLGNGCDTGLFGACKAGHKVCEGNGLVCQQANEPSAETCDGVDNDCNNAVDDVAGLNLGCNFIVPNLNVTCTGALKCPPGGGAPACFPQGPFFADPFGQDGNWNMDNEWAIGATSVSVGQTFGNSDPAMDHSNTADNKVAGIVPGGNGSGQTHEPRYLTSKSLNMNASGTLFLTFWRWLNAPGPDVAKATVEVSSNDGQSWVTVWVNAEEILDDKWTLQYIDLTSYKSAQMKIRFGWEVLTSGTVVSSWNIDDLSLASCPTPG